MKRYLNQIAGIGFATLFAGLGAWAIAADPAASTAAGQPLTGAVDSPGASAVPTGELQAIFGNNITYQGKLLFNNQPPPDAGANSTIDFQLQLYDALTLGNAVGSLASVNDFAGFDDAGVFTLQNLNFGPTAFDGNERWVEIRVRDGMSTGLYTTLTPRQPITAAPHAIKSKAAFALDAADGNPANAVVTDNVGNVGIGRAAPLATTHMANFDLGITSAALENDDLIIESQDAAIGLYSEGSGTWSSAIALKELVAGVLVDTWGIVRRSSVASNPSSLHFTYGPSDNYASNPAAMVITSGGDIGIGTTTPTEELQVFRSQGGATSILVSNNQFSATASAELHLHSVIAVSPTVELADASLSLPGGLAGGDLTIDNENRAIAVNGSGLSVSGPAGAASPDLDDGTIVVNNLFGDRTIELSGGIAGTEDGPTGIPGPEAAAGRLALFRVDGTPMLWLEGETGTLRFLTVNRTRIVPPAAFACSGTAELCLDWSVSNNVATSVCVVGGPAETRDAEAQAMVDLPAGATITSMAADLDDNDGNNNITVRLRRVDGAGVSSVMASVATSGAGGPVTLTDSSIANPVVADSFMYYVTFHAGGITLPTDDLQLSAVRINYTVSKFDPRDH
ncbi:MAG: hypothetical protein SF069_02890 [Phycisphaerae bacterium]|nr:hypothetical protein [Phycisphaerae bacterium]